jgi:hypothetical protein
MPGQPRARRRVSSSTLLERLAASETTLAPIARPGAYASDEVRAQAIRARLALLERVIADPDADLPAQHAAPLAVGRKGRPVRLGLLVNVDVILVELGRSILRETTMRGVDRSMAVQNALSAWDLGGWSPEFERLTAKIDEARERGRSLPTLDGVEGDFFDDPPELDEFDDVDERDELRDELEVRAGLAAYERTRKFFQADAGARLAWYRWAEREGLLARFGLRDADEAAATWAQVHDQRQSLRLDLEKLALLDGRRDIAGGGYGEMCEWGREIGAIGPLATQFLTRPTHVPMNWLEL